MTGPVSSSETGSRVTIHTAADVCELVDQLGKEAVGELVVRGHGSGEVRGVVFIECGRICWAAARGLARRFTELLCARANVAKDEMEAIFRHCQDEHVPLGEFLVARGVVEAPALREALLDHTAESTESLCASDADAAFRPRPGPGYSPRFTFGTVEILARTAARTEGDALSPVLEENFGDGEWGAVYVRGVHARPTPIAVRGDALTRDVLRVGRWAASALDLASTFQDADAFVSVTAPRTVLVAWREGTHLVAGRMKPQGPARILNRRARARRSSG